MELEVRQFEHPLFQEISNRTPLTDPSTWVSNSSSNLLRGPLVRSHSIFHGSFQSTKFEKVNLDAFQCQDACLKIGVSNSPLRCFFPPSIPKVPKISLLDSHCTEECSASFQLALHLCLRRLLGQRGRSPSLILSVEISACSGCKKFRVSTWKDARAAYIIQDWHSPGGTQDATTLCFPSDLGLEHSTIADKMIPRLQRCLGKAAGIWISGMALTLCNVLSRAPLKRYMCCNSCAEAKHREGRKTCRLRIPRTLGK